MPVQALPQGPFVKGVVAANQVLAQPKGAIARGSNLLMSARGALDLCDGSAELFEYTGAVQSNRGKGMADFLFQPIGVPNYYLSIRKDPGAHLGNVKNITSTLGAGGTLAPGTYYYVVTAIDGAGGESIGAATTNQTAGGGNLTINITWNIVPNAVGYNLYRATNIGGPYSLLTGPGLPVPQPAYGNLTASYSDDGTATFVNYNVVAAASGSGGGITTYFFETNVPNQLSAGQFVSTSGFSPPAYNFTSVAIAGIITDHLFSVQIVGPNPGPATVLGIVSGTSFPVVDSTQQTALYKMPVLVGSPAAIPVSYDESNIVAYFPADVIPFPDGGGGGGPGGSGGLGGGGTSGGTGSGGISTPAGGLVGNVSFLPQFKQFTNRAIIALGNGFAVQVYSDATGTPTNPATRAAISSISVDAFGVVTVTTATPHGISTSQAGANVIIAGVTNPIYNMTGPTIAVPSTTQYQVHNLAAIGAGASSGGTSTTTTVPLYNTFVPAYPVWTGGTPGTVLITGDVIVPATQPAQAIYLTVTQGGTTGTTEPIWPTGGQASVGQTVKDGTVIYTVSGLLNAAAPAPPGGAHIEVYSGALWVFNTAPYNTSTGLDGPCALRMSSINNPFSWNPINQAFLDKDDGQQGMGLGKFTITAQGIPPEGSLIAFKNYIPYQIVGLFGSSNFAIQAVSSDMGCTAPRTIQFVPGFGLVRYTHLGFAVFNGVKDEVLSEQIRPYLFPSNDITYQDLTVVDSNWVSVSWAAQTATPPMYVCAMPIGASGGQLTRIFCYDLVFKAWLPVDLPFPISTMSQFRTVSANPVTVFSGFNDGAMSRWQAGDVQWDTGATGARTAQNVTWKARTLEAAASGSDQRIYCRRLVVTGFNSAVGGTITVSWRKNGVLQATRSFPVGSNTFFDLDVAIGMTDKEFDCEVGGNTATEIDNFTYEIEPRPIGVIVAI